MQVFIAIRKTVVFQEALVIKDPAGHYIILVCLLNNIPFTFVNVYAPNVGQVRFLKRVLAKTEELKKGHLQSEGDFNMICDWYADSTAPRRYLSGSLKQFLVKRDLFDIGRCHHATKTYPFLNLT